MGEFDLIGIDLDALKTTDGNLFQWIRKNQPLTVCVIFTTLSAVAAAAAAEQVSAFDYFIKPIESTHLNYCVNRALNHRRLLLAERDVRFSLEKVNKHVGERIRRATSELLDSNERLNAANRAKDHFLAAMSHELRTPLTAITGAVRILQSPTVGEGKAQNILEILDRNVRTLKRLLDDLLDCSRISAGKLNLEIVPVNLVESVSAAVETMRQKAAEAHIKLQVSVPADPVTVDGNSLRLQQIVWNLIDNAIKFTPPHGGIFVALAANGESVDLTVSDSGIGLTEEDKERIFEPFAQAHGAEAQRKGGLGLGLALVRDLTQLHNGQVRVESDGPGHGSRFVVTLPLSGKGQPVQCAA
jgi:signal transduction histidine kinase